MSNIFCCSGVSFHCSESSKAIHAWRQTPEPRNYWKIDFEPLVNSFLPVAFLLQTFKVIVTSAVWSKKRHGSCFIWKHSSIVITKISSYISKLETQIDDGAKGTYRRKSSDKTYQDFRIFCVKSFILNERLNDITIWCNSISLPLGNMQNP